MKILVTSATGLTGKAVVRALAEKGAEVRAMIHSDRWKDEMLSTRCHGKTECLKQRSRP